MCNEPEIENLREKEIRNKSKEQEEEKKSQKKTKK